MLCKNETLNLVNYYIIINYIILLLFIQFSSARDYIFFYNYLN